MPPESLKGSESYNEKDSGYKADIYASGVILFNLVTGCMPYSKASEDHELYVKFIRERTKFWEYHEKYSFEGPIPSDLKALLDGILEPDPHQRFDIKGIKASAWYKQETATQEQVAKEMRKRKLSVNLAKSQPEKRVEITKSWTAKSRGKKGKKKGQQRNGKMLSEIGYEKIGTLVWNICTSIFGK